MYDCAWCDRELKPKMSNSAKNPGRSFVSCSKDHGGCGLFCFLDEQVNDKFRPKDASAAAPTKRAKVDGTQVIGSINQQPNAVEQRLAELCTELSLLRTQVHEVHEFVKQVTEN